MALLLFGPEVIFGFTVAMTLGIFVGTYSSIYMAAPILIWLKVTSGQLRAARDRDGPAGKVGARAGLDAPSNPHIMRRQLRGIFFPTELGRIGCNLSL